MKTTKHFHDRLFQRYGIVLTKEEKVNLEKNIENTKHMGTIKNGEKFDVFLHHRNLKFVAVCSASKIITVHADRRMSRKKFLKKLSKWNSETTKKN